MGVTSYLLTGVLASEDAAVRAHQLPEMLTRAIPQNGTKMTQTRKLCNFLCDERAEQLTVVSIEVVTGQYEFSSPQGTRHNSLALPYVTKWHMNHTCALCRCSSAPTWSA